MSEPTTERTQVERRRSFRMAITEVLIDHMMSLDERRQQRTATTWPDESDIYTGTIARLRVMFRKQMESEGWISPKAAKGLRA